VECDAQASTTSRSGSVLAPQFQTTLRLRPRCLKHSSFATWVSQTSARGRRVLFSRRMKTAATCVCPNVHRCFNASRLARLRRHRIAGDTRGRACGTSRGPFLIHPRNADPPQQPKSLQGFIAPAGLEPGPPAPESDRASLPTVECPAHAESSPAGGRHGRHGPAAHERRPQTTERGGGGDR
jgi:hypothetical protein